MRNIRSNNVAQFDTLEARQLLASNPLSISELSYNNGTQLRITGTKSADQISLTQTKAGLVINNGAWQTIRTGNYNSIRVNAAAGNDKISISPSVKQNTILYGGEGHDTIIAGPGNDSIYGGAGNDKINGGAGDDVIVTLGGDLRDTLIGGEGVDSFWLDAAPTEKASDADAYEKSIGAVHYVGTFKSYNVNGKKISPTKELSGQRIPDPTLTGSSFTYTRFNDRPLFATNGPGADDIEQGQVGNCYFLATLSAVAKSNPQVIKQAVVDLGDGTYGVQFANHNGTKTVVRVDNDFATYKSNAKTLAYAGFGAQGSAWVAVMEKAFAYFRTGESTYASLNAGWMSEAFDALGVKSDSFWKSQNIENGGELASKIEELLDSGKGITLAIGKVPSGQPLIGSHAYSVESIVTNSNGSKSIKLRNPWGVDGAGNDGKNDGYVTISAANCFSGFSAITVG